MPLMAEREPGVFVYENLERPPVLFPDGTQKNLGTLKISVFGSNGQKNKSGSKLKTIKQILTKGN